MMQDPTTGRIGCSRCGCRHFRIKIHVGGVIEAQCVECETTYDLTAAARGE